MWRQSASWSRVQNSQGEFSTWKCFEFTGYNFSISFFLQTTGVKPQFETFGTINMMYASIAVLRVLALKTGPSQIWKDYTKFESHLEERMKTEIYTKVRKILLFPLLHVVLYQMTSIFLKAPCGFSKNYSYTHCLWHHFHAFSHYVIRSVTSVRTRIHNNPNFLTAQHSPTAN